MQTLYCRLQITCLRQRLKFPEDLRNLPEGDVAAPQLGYFGQRLVLFEDRQRLAKEVQRHVLDQVAGREKLIRTLLHFSVITSMVLV